MTVNTWLDGPVGGVEKLRGRQTDYGLMCCSCVLLNPVSTVC